MSAGLFPANRPGPLVRLLLGALLVAALLWLGLDLLFSRRVEHLVGRQAMAHLEEFARYDRLRFDRAVRSRLDFARLAAGRGPAAAAVAAILRRQPAALREAADGSAWLMSSGDLGIFPLTDYVLVMDGDGRPREVDDVGGRAAPPALLAIGRRDVALAARRPLMAVLDGAPFLLSAAAVGETGGTLVLASRLDSHFLATTLGQPLSDRVSLLRRGGDGMVLASSAPERVAPGVPFQPDGAWLTAGKTVFDIGPADRPVSFVTLVPHSEVVDATGALLRLERSQRTMMAAAMSAVLLAVLAVLALRLRRLTGQLAQVTEDNFVVGGGSPRRGDDLVALQREVERLAGAVASSREALKVETADRIRLLSEQMAVRGEVERLRLLQAVTERLGIGVVVIREDGPECENEVMRALAARSGGVEPFIAAKVRGEDEVRLDGRVFELSLAREIDPGMLLVRDVTEQRQSEEAVRSFALFPAQIPIRCCGWMGAAAWSTPTTPRPRCCGIGEPRSAAGCPRPGATRLPRSWRTAGCARSRRRWAATS